MQFSWYVKDLGAYSAYINQSDDTQSYMCSSIRLLVLITPTPQLFITYLYSDSLAVHHLPGAAGHEGGETGPAPAGVPL